MASCGMMMARRQFSTINIAKLYFGQCVTACVRIPTDQKARNSTYRGKLPLTDLHQLERVSTTALFAARCPGIAPPRAHRPRGNSMLLSRKSAETSAKLAALDRVQAVIEF